MCRGFITYYILGGSIIVGCPTISTLICPFISFGQTKLNAVIDHPS
jgi:hypothetical protein